MGLEMDHTLFPFLPSLTQAITTFIPKANCAQDKIYVKRNLMVKLVR